MIPQRQAQYGEQGLRVVLVIEEGANGPATAGLCAKLAAQYTTPVTVVYDPKKAFRTLFAQAGPNEINVVLRQGGEITYLERYADQAEVGKAIEAALAVE